MDKVSGNTDILEIGHRRIACFVQTLRSFIENGVSESVDRLDIFSLENDIGQLENFRYNLSNGQPALLNQGGSILGKVPPRHLLENHRVLR